MSYQIFDKFDPVTDKYLPSYGQGENRAQQLVTALNKLIYKWYNDGDVFDNTHELAGWVNDLSDYANWIYKYGPAAARNILNSIADCRTARDYENLLYKLAEACWDMEDLEKLAQNDTVDDIYMCDGPFEFVDYDEEDEYDDYDEYDEEDEEDDYDGDDYDEDDWR